MPALEAPDRANGARPPVLHPHPNDPPQTRNGSRPKRPPPAVIDHGPSDRRDVMEIRRRGKGGRRQEGPSSFRQPILDRQTGNVAEVALVVGDEGGA